MGATQALPRPGEISLLELYRRMVWVRAWEETRRAHWLQYRPPDKLYLAIGQEAVSVGLAVALAPDDRLFTSRRGLALHLARSLDPEALLDAHPAGGSPFASGGSGTPAGHLPIAVGAALALRLDGGEGVAMVEFGDGAAADGLFHESLNLATLWSAPILFACVNNQYAGDRPTETIHAAPSIALRSSTFGIPAERIDGQDAQTVLATTTRLLEEVRRTSRPALLECVTYRVSEHEMATGGEERETRPREELDFWRNRDPLRRFRALLLRRELAHAETLAMIEAGARQAVEELAHRRNGAPDSPIDPSLALTRLDATPGWGAWE